MDQLTIEELPYTVDSAPLFANFLDLEQPIYLDSCAPYSARGRYDIFTAEPLKSIKQRDTYYLNSLGYKDKVNYFLTLKQTLDELTPRINNDYHLPFVGGALGYFGYDLSRQLEQLPTIPDTAVQEPSLADAVVGIYSWAVIIDHRQQRSLLVAHPQTNNRLLKEVRQRLKGCDRRKVAEFKLCSAFQSNMSGEEYAAAFQRIKDYIDAGDCYQINLAQRFSASCEGDPWAAYQVLRATAAAPFSAYMKVENSAILSMSPERFLHVGNQRVTTSPIKGTIGRGNTPEADAKQVQQLLHSAKDRAENVMIVDLLRNDLGKSCEPGSIQVNELFELQSFATVHHLVSTITGQLTTKLSPLQLLAGCFPGGSITGAPKVRAMEIIAELEPHRRSVYCGSLGYISCDGQMDTNIAIRTMVQEGDQIHCWAGGGIVADSNCDSEYQECLTKVEQLLAVLAAPLQP
ncbi:MAG: aminodeoxychorismate synthase component I [Pseudomonadales bacterium]